jgi:hypothetical protein
MVVGIAMLVEENRDYDNWKTWIVKVVDSSRRNLIFNSELGVEGWVYLACAMPLTASGSESWSLEGMCKIVDWKDLSARIPDSESPKACTLSIVTIINLRRSTPIFQP